MQHVIKKFQEYNCKWQKSMHDLNLATIPFEVVALCSDTQLPVLLLCLERSLEFLKTRDGASGWASTCLEGPSHLQHKFNLNLISGRGKSHRDSNLTSRWGGMIVFVHF